jgi:hypothetical protein
MMLTAAAAAAATHRPARTARPRRQQSSGRLEAVCEATPFGWHNPEEGLRLVLVPHAHLLTDRGTAHKHGCYHAGGGWAAGGLVAECVKALTWDNRLRWRGAPAPRRLGGRLTDIRY